MNYMQAVQHVFFLDRLDSFEYVWASCRVEFSQVAGAPPCLLLAGGKHLVTSGMMMYLVVYVYICTHHTSIVMMMYLVVYVYICTHHTSIVIFWTCLNSVDQLSTGGHRLSSSAAHLQVQYNLPRKPLGRRAALRYCQHLPSFEMDIDCPRYYIYIWLVVWNMNFIFHNIWDNPSHWLSYFSRWLKPPTRYEKTDISCKIITSSLRHHWNNGYSKENYPNVDQYGLISG